MTCRAIGACIRCTEIDNELAQPGVHATRWPADHGRGGTIDREAGNATLWLGRWEVHVDVARPGLMTGAAVAVLASGAVLAALLGRR